ncbi:MAG: site-2 protease family protein [Eubacteriales bacterium]|nr:site-2 protease family protein [Eubacteriales bacterium]
MLKIILAIVIFSVIVIIHELGHFLLAKRAGICVEEFAIGIGPTLFGIQRGETKYSIKCLPFGGCCMMLGEDGEDSDPRAFGNKSALARFSVIFAGPLFNFILAFFLALFVVGIGGADPAVIGKVSEGSAAYEAGLREGDTILRMDGSRIYNFREIRLYNFIHTEDPAVEITYKREGKKDKVMVNRHEENGSYMLGVSMAPNQDVGILGTIKYSFLEVRYQIKSTLVSLKYLVSGRASLNDMSGPVGIVNMIGDTYEKTIVHGVKVAALSLLSFAILLSANLGVMNLLPFPALDGGRLVFIVLEMIRRKRMSPDKEGMIHFAGLVVLLAFMVFVMANDIRNIFF